MPIVISVVNVHALSVCASAMLSDAWALQTPPSPVNMSQIYSRLVKTLMVQSWAEDEKSALVVLLRDLQRLGLKLSDASTVCRVIRRLDGR